MFQFGSQENLQAPAAPVPIEDEGPNLLKLVLDQHAQKLKKILEGETLFHRGGGGDRAGARAGRDGHFSDQPSQPVAQQALERAKTKIAETCERHQEMVLQCSTPIYGPRVARARLHAGGRRGRGGPAAAPASRRRRRPRAASLLKTALRGESRGRR